MPTCNSTAVGSGLDDLRLTTILVGKGDLCSLSCLDSHRLGRCGIVNPVLLRTIGFCNRIGAGFQIQGDNTGSVGHIVTDLRAAGALHREVPARYGTAVGSGLDDLCFTLPLVGKGHAGSFTSFYCDLSRGCGIINPVLVSGGLLCYRVGTRFQINGNHTGGIRGVGSDSSTGSILHCKCPAGNTTAVGGFLNDLGSTFGFLGNHIEVDRNRVTGGFL